MQEQRGAMGSFSEPLGFEHGSTSSDVVNSPSNRLPDYISLNSTSQEGQNASMWTVGEPSSSSGSTHVNQGHSVLSLGDHGSSSSSFSDPFGPSTEPFDLDPHHASRKRKAVELSIGQSSSSSGVGSGSSSVFRTPVDDPTFDPIIPRLGLSIGDHPVHEPAHGNVNLRINSSRQQVEQPFVANDNNRESDVSVLRLTPPSETVLRVPASRRSFQSSRWTRNTSSRPILRDGNELDSISDHPLFAPPSEVTGGGDGGGSGGAASNLSGPSSGVSPSYHSRRLSAFLRRSLLSGTGPDGGERENANIFPRIPPALRSSSSSSSQDVGGLPRQHHQPSSRSSLLLGRQLDGASGFPFHSRSTMTHGSEGRGRLVSEIRSVLEHMRRGEPLRFEDLMILDQSVFYGIADIHDRHRDMRLDIDNMSYEELLALEERIGNVNTGLTEETISKHIRQKQYAVETGRPDSEPCCICQEEYKDGDDLGTLECGHEFHHGCIKQWLQHKNLCPICKSAGFETT